MRKVTDISIYRSKQHIGHDPDSFRTAAAIMLAEDLNEVLEREYQGHLKAKAAFDSMFETPLQQLENWGYAMRTYRAVHSSKQSQEYKAAADYANGSYENENPRQSPLWMEYYMAFYELVALEQIELNNEVQGN